MLIRCDKCTTVYELDETLLPPQGAPVQCSKCQYVFTAYPPAPAPRPEPFVREVPPPAPDEAPGGGEEPPEDEPVPADLMPGGGADGASEPAPALPRERDAEREGAFARPDASDEPEPAPPREPEPVVPDAPAPARLDAEDGVVSAPRLAPRAAAGPRARAPRAPSSSSGGEPATAGPQFTADGRPIRKVPFPTEDPQPPRDLPGLKPPRGGVRVDAGRRRTGWVVIAAVLIVLALVFAGWRLLGRRSDGAAASRPVGAAEPARPTEGDPADERTGASPLVPAASPDRAAEPERRARGRILPTAPPPRPARNAPRT